ncbi:MAG: Nif3-like dinuclear metal center hexameric protein [Planctomycetes bacterium RBG_16_55_9]|nr:MAG: Nif3-like dinuclear metal center hexameric protein [Planctomycetes bacterium RBG_16_55_9]
MKAKDITFKIEEMYPLSLAQGWDNVGFLVGDPQKDIENILLTIDITNDVLAEAIRLKTDLILSYHPVIWDGLKKVIAEGPTHVVYELIRSGIAVFSIHTALDSAVDGVNDGLAEMIGIVGGKPIGDYVGHPGGGNYKLVVFVPIEFVADVSNAIFAAGAGAIGNYSKCSFSAEGTGTFLPQKGAKPAIGKKGKLEQVAEMRFETIVPADKLDAVVAAMRKAHPYETPAFDIFKIYGTEGPFGLGRIGELTRPLHVAQIVKKIKEATGAKAMGLIGDEGRLVKRAAVCAGSCGEILNQVIAAKVDLYLTGELKHHQALAAQEAGLTCICLSHTVSERFMLKKVAQQLHKHVNGIKIRISKKDADPFKWKKI